MKIGLLVVVIGILLWVAVVVVILDASRLAEKKNSGIFTVAPDMTWMLIAAGVSLILLAILSFALKEELWLHWVAAYLYLFIGTEALLLAAASFWQLSIRRTGWLAIGPVAVVLIVRFFVPAAGRTKK